jgi:hypothetical protein
LVTGDALSALKISMNVPDNQLKDWNPNQVTPCTWTNVICDSNEHVISVYVFFDVVLPLLSAVSR